MGGGGIGTGVGNVGEMRRISETPVRFAKFGVFSLLVAHMRGVAGGSDPPVPAGMCADVNRLARVPDLSSAVGVERIGSPVVSSAPSALRIGVFGGTFDPPHVGHLVTAINVAHSLDLHSVIMMVNNVPWQKVGSRPITPALDRLAMVQAAVANVPRLTAGDIEIRVGGHSYTADTLGYLAAEYPDAEFFVVLGDDAAAAIRTWERADEVIAQARLVVVDRPGQPAELDPDIDWIRIEVPRLEVSSTDLRDRWADGRPLDYLVTEDVLAVIAARGLYGNGSSGAAA